MINIFTAAKYILSKTGEITTLKLQKLLYYSQAWSLVWDDKELFKEDFEAWANGPVSRELYNYHRGLFQINDIPDEKCEGTLTEEQKETLEAVLEFYADMKSHELSALTHREQPWLIARGECDEGDYCDNIIQKEAIYDYYGSL